MASVHAAFNQALGRHIRHAGKTYFKKISRKNFHKHNINVISKCIHILCCIYICVCIYICTNIFYKFIENIFKQII